MSPDELPPVPRLPSRAAANRRRPPRPRALSRETIAEAALAIIDNEGLDAMTMRTVAHSLGTGQASLYAHVSGKEELLELVIERVIGEVPFGGEPDPAHWQEQLKEGLRGMRAVFSSHRDLARASFARIPLGENALRGSEWMIGVMRAGALPDRVIALACDLLPLYAMAVAYEESLYAEGQLAGGDGRLHRFDARLLRRAAAGAVSQRGCPGRRRSPRAMATGTSASSSGSRCWCAGLAAMKR